MDKKFVIKTIVGHVGRILVPLVLWLLARAGMSAAEAGPQSAVAAESLAGLVGVGISVWWSYRTRKALQEAEPPE